MFRASEVSHIVRPQLGYRGYKSHQDVSDEEFVGVAAGRMGLNLKKEAFGLYREAMRREAIERGLSGHSSCGRGLK